MPQGVESFSDCTDCPTMIVIPAQQGAPVGATPEERVALDGSSVPLPRSAVDIQRFALGQTEITIDQFKAFAAATGYKTKPKCGHVVRGWLLVGPQFDADFEHPGFPVSGDYPVGCMRLEDAEAYVAWLSRQTGQRYRLPTEVEWEYVARGGTPNHSYLGTNEPDPSTICLFENVKNGDYRGYRGKHFSCDDGFGEATSPVAYFKPNQFGVYDILGNVSELISDCVREHGTMAAGDPPPSESCAYALSKGGSFVIGQEGGIAALRIAKSRKHAPSNSLGFRVARDLD
ncbi:formylglycine-generating enzyme family protein [Dongia sp.]|uniref:formylglycine-generating enzyme family protein n=1 Tax=Dongia sp. TaxID=1977262 RepID=UPI00375349EE